MNGSVNSNYGRSTESLLDENKLKSIRDLTDSGDEVDFLTSLIRMFFERTPQLIEDIVQGISDQDAKLLEHSSHALKGTAGNIGAYPLMKVCEQLEERGRVRDFSDVDELRSELHDIFAATAAALKAELNQNNQSA